MIICQICHLKLFCSLFFILDFVIGLNTIVNYGNCYPKSILYSPCRRDLNSQQHLSDILYRVTPYVNLWLYLLSTKCHPDLNKLLCSIHSPECRKSFRRERRYACQRMCRDIETECLPHVSVYGYKWPSEADCSSLPHSDCIDLTNPHQSGYYKKFVKRQREDRSSNKTMYNNEENNNKMNTGNDSGAVDKNEMKRSKSTNIKPIVPAGDKPLPPSSNVSTISRTSLTSYKKQQVNKTTILSDQQQKQQQHGKFKNDNSCSTCYQKMDPETFSKEFCKHPMVIRVKINKVISKANNIMSLELDKMKSKILYSDLSNPPPIKSIQPLIRCKCQALKRQIRKQIRMYGKINKPLRGKWILMGTITSSNILNIATLLKWRHRSAGNRFVLRKLKKKRKRWCRKIDKLMKLTKLKATNNQNRNNNKRGRRKSSKRKRREYRKKRNEERQNQFNSVNWNFPSIYDN